MQSQTNRNLHLCPSLTLLELRNYTVYEATEPSLTSGWAVTMQQEKRLVLTFPKTSIVTKFSLSAHPSKSPPQFFASQPESPDGPWFDRHVFRNKKKNHWTPKANEEALQIGSKGIELVTHQSRRLRSSFGWFLQSILLFTLHTFVIDEDGRISWCHPIVQISKTKTRLLYLR